MKHGKFKIPNKATLMNIYVFKYLRLDLHDYSLLMSMVIHVHN